jgi:hypothetical protein
MNAPLQLNENYSNLVWAAKHWWDDDATKAGAKDNFECFWFVVSAVYERVYEYEPNLAGIYSFVSDVWWATMSGRQNFQYLFEQYQNDTMPSASGRCSGTRYGRRLLDTNTTYNDRQIVMARIAKMMSQMRQLSVEQIELAPRWTNLEVKKVSLDFLG